MINDDQIVTESLTLEESLCSDDYLRFGACEAAKFEITVADVAEDIKNHWFTAELIIADYKLAFGIYKVDDVVIQKDKRFKKIIAYDRMKEFDTDVSIWYKNLSFPLSMREFQNSFLNYFGFPYDTVTLINDTMTVTQSNTDPTINGRKVIESICEINGVFGSFDGLAPLNMYRLAMAASIRRRTFSRSKGGCIQANRPIRKKYRQLINLWITKNGLWSP